MNGDNSDKGYIESAIDKTKEMAHNAKEAVGDAYDKVTGKTNEQKAADTVKDAADTTADKAEEARKALAEKLGDSADALAGNT